MGVDLQKRSLPLRTCTSRGRFTDYRLTFRKGKATGSDRYADTEVKMELIPKSPVRLVYGDLGTQHPPSFFPYSC